MNIPDGLVYASLPVLLGAIYKAGRWFVQDVVSTNKKANRENARIDDRSPGPAPLITLHDFDDISSLMKKELNGRYMLAPEAREKFASLERLIEQLTRRIDALLSQVTHLSNKAS